MFYQRSPKTRNSAFLRISQILCALALTTLTACATFLENKLTSQATLHQAAKNSQHKEKTKVFLEVFPYYLEESETIAESKKESGPSPLLHARYKSMLEATEQYIVVEQKSEADEIWTATRTFHSRQNTPWALVSAASLLIIPYWDNKSFSVFQLDVNSPKTGKIIFSEAKTSRSLSVNHLLMVFAMPFTFSNPEDDTDSLFRELVMARIAHE